MLPAVDNITEQVGSKYLFSLSGKDPWQENATHSHHVLRQVCRYYLTPGELLRFLQPRGHSALIG